MASQNFFKLESYFLSIIPVFRAFHHRNNAFCGILRDIYQILPWLQCHQTIYRLYTSL